MEDNQYLARLHHVCLVVKDADKAAERLESLGLGPFSQIDVDADVTIRGKPVVNEPVRKELLGAMGPVALQLLEPGSGESPWREYLEQRGEGLHHVCFLVDDVDAMEAKLLARGFTIAVSARFKDGGGGAVSIDSDAEPGGLGLEFIQLPPGASI